VRRLIGDAKLRGMFLIPQDWRFLHNSTPNSAPLTFNYRRAGRSKSRA
jgi:hypothetical protein